MRKIQYMQIQWKKIGQIIKYIFYNIIKYTCWFAIGICIGIFFQYVYIFGIGLIFGYAYCLYHHSNIKQQLQKHNITKTNYFFKILLVAICWPLIFILTWLYFLFVYNDD